MSDESNLLEWSFKGAVTIILFIGWWMWTQLVRRVSALFNKQNAHELHVAREYSTKSELGMIRLETIDSIKRVHDRIDEGNSARERNFQETNRNISDIKDLLIEGARK